MVMSTDCFGQWSNGAEVELIGERDNRRCEGAVTATETEATHSALTLFVLLLIDRFAFTYLQLTAFFLAAQHSVGEILLSPHSVLWVIYRLCVHCLAECQITWAYKHMRCHSAHLQMDSCPTGQPYVLASSLCKSIILLSLPCLRWISCL